MININSYYKNSKQSLEKYIDRYYWDEYQRLKKYDFKEVHCITDNKKQEIIESYYFKKFSEDRDEWCGFDEIFSSFVDWSITLDESINEKLQKGFQSGDFFYKYPLTKKEMKKLWPELRKLTACCRPARKVFIQLVKGLKPRQNIVEFHDYCYSTNHFTISPIINYCVEELLDVGLIVDSISFEQMCLTQTNAFLSSIIDEYGLQNYGRKADLVNELSCKTTSLQKQEVLKRITNPESRYFRINLVEVAKLKKYFWSTCSRLDYYFNHIKSATIDLDSKKSDGNFPLSASKERQKPDNKWEKRYTEGINIVQKYWNEDLDNLIIDLVSKEGEGSKIFFNQVFENYHTAETLKQYKIECLQARVINYYTMPVIYGDIRIKELAIPKREEKKKICKNCQKMFTDSTVEFTYYRALLQKISEIRFCNRCYAKAMFNKSGTLKRLKKETMAIRLKGLYDLLEFIPTSSFMKSPKPNLSGDKLDDFILMWMRIPYYDVYIDKFGSWFKALVAAGIIEGGVMESTYGYRCLAKDGHECFSLSEKIIDDWMYKNSIIHEKEVLYPFDKDLNPTQLRADWCVNNVLIEYAGLMSDPAYARTIMRKRELCAKQDIELIVIEPHDIATLDEIMGKFIGNE